MNPKGTSGFIGKDRKHGRRRRDWQAGTPGRTPPIPKRARGTETNTVTGISGDRGRRGSTGAKGGFRELSV